MGHYFVAILNVVCELTNPEFEILFKAAERHYDHTISATTRIGGQLFGLRNRRNFNNDPTTEFTERGLNLMMKALEFSDSKEAQALREKFITMFKELQQKTVEVNRPLNNIEFVGHFTGK